MQRAGLLIHFNPEGESEEMVKYSDNSSKEGNFKKSTLQ